MQDINSEITLTTSSQEILRVKVSELQSVFIRSTAGDSIVSFGGSAHGLPIKEGEVMEIKHDHFRKDDPSIQASDLVITGFSAAGSTILVYGWRS